MLDGFGRPDVLGDCYGLDSSTFTASLKERGFDVLDDVGGANYLQTALSLASMLNVRSLVDSPHTTSRAAAYRMIQDNVVFTTFKQLG